MPGDGSATWPPSSLAAPREAAYRPTARGGIIGRGRAGWRCRADLMRTHGPNELGSGSGPAFARSSATATAARGLSANAVEPFVVDALTAKRIRQQPDRVPLQPSFELALWAVLRRDLSGNVPCADTSALR